MTNYNDLNISYQYGDLAINGDQLTSLERCPEHITGSFHCVANDLTSLIGGPQQVDSWYMCNDNKLTDLIGCASHIGGQLHFTNNNNITSLVGIHKIIKSCQRLKFDSEYIKIGGIGLLLIANLTKISIYNPPFEIIALYLGTGTKGMMECSKELIAKGYAPYAKL